MKSIFLILLLSLIFLSFKVFSQEILSKMCTSQTGKSIYEIALLPKKNSMGEIRLKFNGEDNLYSAKVVIVSSESLIGVAKFKDSKTGQTMADPWVFTYLFQTNKLIDDGRLEANCN
jgi:hypothetical protein